MLHPPSKAAQTAMARLLAATPPAGRDRQTQLITVTLGVYTLDALPPSTNSYLLGPAPLPSAVYQPRRPRRPHAPSPGLCHCHPLLCVWRSFLTLAQPAPLSSWRAAPPPLARPFPERSHLLPTPLPSLFPSHQYSPPPSAFVWGAPMAAHPLLHLLPGSPLPKPASLPLPTGRCLLPHTWPHAFIHLRIHCPPSARTHWTLPSPPTVGSLRARWAWCTVGRGGQAILTHWEDLLFA